MQGRWSRFYFSLLLLKHKLFSISSLNPIGASFLAFNYSFLKWFVKPWAIWKAVAAVFPVRPRYIYDETAPRNAPRVLTMEEYHQRVLQEEHPPTPAERFQRLDGSGNNIEYPWLGQGGRPFGRFTALNPTKSNLPDPAVVFDELMRRDLFVPAPLGQNAVQSNLALLVAHDFFRTEESDGVHSLRNLHSSYLDLQPLYGHNEDTNTKVRAGQGGLLKLDMFADERLSHFPGVKALLILFNKEHNFIATQLAQRFPDQFTTDHDLFYQARQIIIGVYHNVLLRDYAGGVFNAFHKSGGPLIPLKTLNKFRHPLGFHTTLEFRERYLLHSVLPGSVDGQEDHDAPIDVNYMMKLMFSEPSGAFCPNNIPVFLKRFHEHNLKFCRDTGMCSMNQFRRAIKLSPLRFEDYDITVRNKLRKLYKSADDIELTPGLTTENTLSIGWSASETITNTIMADIAGSLANDRFATVNFTAEYLTDWGLAHTNDTTLQSLVNRHTDVGPLDQTVCLTMQGGMQPWEIAKQAGWNSSKVGRIFRRTIKALFLAIFVPIAIIFYPIVMLIAFPLASIHRCFHPFPIEAEEFTPPPRRKNTNGQSTNYDVDVGDSEPALLPPRLGPHFVRPGAFVVFLSAAMMWICAPFAVIFFALLMLTGCCFGACSNEAMIRRLARWKLWIWITYPRSEHRQGVLCTFFRGWITPICLVELHVLKSMISDPENPRPSDEPPFHSMLAKSHEIIGENAVFANSVLVCDHDQVVQRLSKHHKRGNSTMTGFQKNVPWVDSTNLTILIDGDMHAKRRHLAVSIIHHPSSLERQANMKVVLKDTIDNWLKALPPPFMPIEKYHVVEALLLQSVYKIMLGIDLTEEQANFINKRYSPREPLNMTTMAIIPRWLDTLLLYIPSTFAAKGRLKTADIVRQSAVIQDVSKQNQGQVGVDEFIMMSTDLTMVAGVGGGAMLLLPLLFDKVRFDRMQARLFRAHPTEYLMETMRLFMPIPVLPIVLQKPEEFAMMGKKYTLPAGTTFGCGLYRACMDPKLFPNPHQFRLDRDPSKTLAFGVGHHKCPGAKLSMELMTLLVNAFIDHHHPGI